MTTRRKDVPAKANGRPTKCTPAVTEQVVELARQGVGPGMIAQKIGVHRVTLLRWCTRGLAEPDGRYGRFAQDYNAAVLEYVRKQFPASDALVDEASHMLNLLLATLGETQRQAFLAITQGKRVPYTAQSDPPRPARRPERLLEGTFR